MRARHLQLLAGITLAGAVLRFATLDVQSYWLDEVATVNILRHGFGDMFSAISSGESTPPVYYVIAWVWAKVFGTGEVGLRSLSALIGTATIVLAYILGRDFVNRATGVVVAAITAFSPILVWYSQEARSYALLILLTGLSLLALQRVLTDPTPKRLAWWAVAAIASIATHYYAGFLIGAEAAWLAIAAWRGSIGGVAGASGAGASGAGASGAGASGAGASGAGASGAGASGAGASGAGASGAGGSGPRGRVAFAIGAVAVAALALLPLALHQRSSGAAKFIGESGLVKRVVQIPKQFAIGYQGPAEALLTVAAVVLLGFGVFRLLTAEPTVRIRGLQLAALGVVTVAVPLAFAVLGSDYLIARNVIAAWLPLAIAVSVGFSRGTVGAIATAALCAIGLVVVIGVNTNERYQRDNWRGAAEFIGKPDQPRVVIVTPAGGSDPLQYYLHGAVKTPPTGVDVKELVFVGLARRAPGEAPAPPRPPQVGAANFTETRRRQADTYTVVVEQSPVGAHIPRQVGASALDGQPALTLYQR